MYTKSISLIIVSFLFCNGLFAQNKDYSKEYASEINVQSAKKHLTTLSSDEFGGRDTGKPSGHKAAKYLAEAFQQIGLSAPVNGGYLQKVPLVESVFETQEFSINGTEIKVGDGFYMTGSGNEKKIQSNNIVFIGYGISSPEYDDLANVDIEGKVVLLINEGEPMDPSGKSYITKTDSLSEWATSRNKRIQAVLAKQPALILAISSQVDTLLARYGQYFSRPRVSLKEDYKAQSAPAIAHINEQLANRILTSNGTSIQALRDQINLTGKPASRNLNVDILTTYGTRVKDLEADNILGYLEGTDLKDELLVISAHYDHVGIDPTGDVFNGADDDGSGTTGVLEIAKAFMKSKNEGHGPRRSILFLLVTGEEKGLLGSDYYTKHPVFPLERTVTDLNIDMIGRIDPPHKTDTNYVYLIGSDKLSSTLHKLSEEANQEYTQLKLDYKYNDPNDPERIYYRSDHYNFAKNKIPVIFYFNGVHEDYHKVSDTVDKINFEMLVKRAKLVFHTAWKVANLDKRPVVDSNKK